MKKSTFAIKRHDLNYHNLGHLKWTGTFWIVSRNSCANLNPDGRYMENKKHNCKAKNFPITYQVRGSERGFSVTDEKLQEMQDDGRLERLQKMGTRVDGGVDPLYFEWHNKISQIGKTLSNRSNAEYKNKYPYLELYSLDDLGDSVDGMLNYLAQITSQFYTGESLPKKHEATLKFISETSNLNLLKNARDRYTNVIDDMRKANDNPTTQAIDIVFNEGLELLGSNPITDALSFGFGRIKRLTRVMENLLVAELNEINERINTLQAPKSFLPVMLPTTTKNEEEKTLGDKLAIPVIGTLALLNIMALFG